MLYTDVFQPLTCLKAGSPIYNLQNLLSHNINNVYNNVKVEVDIVFNDEIEVTRQATMSLACIAIFCQLTEYMDINFVFSPMGNSFKTTT